MALLFSAWRAAAERQAALRHAARELAARTSTGRLRRLIYLWRWYAARQRYLRQVRPLLTGAAPACLTERSPGCLQCAFLCAFAT